MWFQTLQIAKEGTFGNGVLVSFSKTYQVVKYIFTSLVKLMFFHTDLHEVKSILGTGKLWTSV